MTEVRGQTNRTASHLYLHSSRREHNIHNDFPKAVKFGGHTQYHIHYKVCFVDEPNGTFKVLYDAIIYQNEPCLKVFMVSFSVYCNCMLWSTAVLLHVIAAKIVILFYDCVGMLLSAWEIEYSDWKTHRVNITRKKTSSFETCHRDFLVAAEES